MRFYAKSKFFFVNLGLVGDRILISPSNHTPKTWYALLCELCICSSLIIINFRNQLGHYQRIIKYTNWEILIRAWGDACSSCSRRVGALLSPALLYFALASFLSVFSNFIKSNTLENQWLMFDIIIIFHMTSLHECPLATAHKLWDF